MESGKPITTSRDRSLGAAPVQVDRHGDSPADRKAASDRCAEPQQKVRPPLEFVHTGCVASGPHSPEPPPGVAMSERTVFLAALEILDPAERAAYLDRACAGDPAV